MFGVSFVSVLYCAVFFVPPPLSLSLSLSLSRPVDGVVAGVGVGVTVAVEEGWVVVGGSRVKGGGRRGEGGSEGLYVCICLIAAEVSR